MRTELSTDEITRYREHGFVVVPDLLSPPELEHWRDAIERALAERGDFTLPGQRTIERDDYYKMIFKQRINLWQTSEQARELMFDGRLGRLAADLAGVEGIRIHHDQALVKPPYGNPTAWHLDVPYWPFTSPDAISIWVALDDATLQNGCLMYIPGSHKAQKYDNVRIGKEIGALFAVYPEWGRIDPVPCPVPAGGCVFHNGLTAHAAGANMTPRPRRAMTCAYMPDGATFNGTQNILTDEYVARLSIGDPLQDDSVNPLIFSRVRPPVAA